MKAFLLVALQISLSIASQCYDYVIVGGGTAGLALANRLSEHFTVAVIEAGGYYEDIDPTAEVPGLAGTEYPKDPSAKFPIDWNFVTTPQPGANGRIDPYWRGKCLGGRYVLSCPCTNERQCLT